MKNIILVLSVFLWSCTCQKKTTRITDHKEDSPKKESVATPESCIQERIAIFSKNTQCNSGGKVSSYMFQNQLVYVFETGPCGADMTAPVYDEHCHKLGALGGFMGNTKIKGVHFSEAVFKEVVWEQKK